MENTYKILRSYTLPLDTVKRLEELAKLLAADGDRPNQSATLVIAIDRLYSDTVQANQPESVVTGTA